MAKCQWCNSYQRKYRKAKSVEIAQVTGKKIAIDLCAEHESEYLENQRIKNDSRSKR